MRLDFLFLLKEKVVVEVYFVILKRNGDQVYPDLSSISTTFTWVNARSDCNRWFIWSLSCEWGCTIPSTNDRGSQAPSVCPCGAKNWSVWWVPLGFLHLQADATSPLVLFPSFLPTFVHWFILSHTFEFLELFFFPFVYVLYPPGALIHLLFSYCWFFSPFRCLSLWFVLEHNWSINIMLSLFL